MKKAYRMGGKHISFTHQSAQLPEIKAIRLEYEAIYSQVLQDVLYRVDKAFKAFFRRCQAGQTPGHPRFKSNHRYDSFTYPQSGFGIDEVAKVVLPTSEAQVGIDVGLKTFAYLSDGTTIDNPRFFRGKEKALVRAHQHERSVAR